MRKIKFRCWDSNNKEMINSYTLANDPELLRDILTASETIGVIPMQYTGLKDKQEKDIYEGDILQWGDEPFGMEVKQFEGCWVAETSGGRIFYSTGIFTPSFKELEIIGNIYEHPELLK